jgi:hypothetical protein
MDIHQVSVDYLHEQDRILVRVNTREAEEIRLWLTRRLCSGWMPLLRATLESIAAPPTESGACHAGDVNARPIDSAGKPWAPEFRTLRHLKQSDFQTPFKSEARAWPLGAEPLLVTTVRMAPVDGGGLELSFEESLIAQKVRSRSFRAMLEPALLHGFMHLLEQALTGSDWSAPGARGVEAGTGHPVADEAMAAERPRYLH